MKIKCISIVSPNGTCIARGEKTLEIRSWLPNLEAGEALLIVENHTFLREEGAVDPNGTPVALVKIGKVREYMKEDIPAACATRWDPGYFAWELFDVRSFYSSQTVVAARGIYELDLDPTAFCPELGMGLG